MSRPPGRTPLRLSLPVALIMAACSGDQGYDIGTPEDRAALFDDLVTKTSAWEAWSPVKNARLEHDPEAAMQALRDEVVAADTEEELFYALSRLSAARKDRHLTVGLVDGGLRLADTAGIDQSNYPIPGSTVPHAPVRFAVDYGREDAPELFISDVAAELEEIVSRGDRPLMGNRVSRVNGRPLAEYIAMVEPYHRYSSVNSLWWQLAEWLPQRSAQFPPWVYDDDLLLTLRRDDDSEYTVSLPYLPRHRVHWTTPYPRRYPNTYSVLETGTFTLFLPNDDAPYVLLRWNGFQDGLTADMDTLMTYAEREGLLDRSVIVDATRSRGGSNGAYALRRLSPTPFRTTFGNLRISDASRQFVRDRASGLGDRPRFAGVAGDGDDGTWLLDWIENDFAEADARGDDYTPPVPFKLAHLPKDADGIVQPAAVHFRGQLIVWLSPYGGSHLDQFASMVADNDLGITMGMPPAGYSNTWEWEEILEHPATGEPLVSFMWNIGHSIRPNGEVLEGNPIEVDEYVPVTRDNFRDYHPTLLRRSLARLGIE